MGRLRSHYNDVITYDDSLEAKELLYEIILNYFKSHDMFISEGVFQDDDTQLDAPALLCDLIDDVFKFKYENEGE